MQATFPYDSRNLSDLVSAISQQRLQRYASVAAGDVAQALRLYMWNVALSETLYGPLQGLEITHRNRIHDRLSAAILPAWYDDSSVGLRHAQTQQVHRASWRT